MGNGEEVKVWEQSVDLSIKWPRPRSLVLSPIKFSPAAQQGNGGQQACRRTHLMQDKTDHAHTHPRTQLQLMHA